MTTDELNSRLSDAGLMIIDVRTAGDWNKSGEMIKGAKRKNPNEVSTWIPGVPRDKTIVLYCS